MHTAWSGSLLAGPLAALFVNHDEVKIAVDNPVLLNAALFGILLAAVVLTLKKAPGDEPLSVLQTDQVKGAAILLVLVGHLYGYAVEDYPQMAYVKEVAGSVGVALFLVLSGYGLCVSLQAKGLKNYFSRRIARIYVPVVLAMTLEIALNRILLQEHKTSLAREFANIVINLAELDRNLWFITFILFWYILLFALFTFGTSDQGKLVALFVTALLLLTQPKISTSWKINAFSYPLGCWLGLYSSAAVAWLQAVLRRSIVMLVLLIAALVLLALGARAFRGRFENSPVLTAGFAVVALAVVIFWLRAARAGRAPLFEVASALLAIVPVGFYLRWALDTKWGQEEGIDWWAFTNLEILSYAAAVMFLVLLLVKYGLQSRLLRFVGKISYEIYLLHGMFLYSYDFILFRGNLIATFFVYVAAVCLASVVLHKLSALATRLLPRG